MSVKHLLLGGAKVAANNTDDANVSKVTSGDREMGSRATQHLFVFTKGRFDRVECH